MKSVRTRFAPSPTGYLHVGNVRAALFPWLIAQQAGGTFVLRIEDTDQAREVSGAIDVMRETLQWLGMEWDEGPDKPGDFGPYVQSERRTLYLKWAQRMADEGLAYADIRTPDELKALREDAKSKKQAFLARNYRPDQPQTWQPGMPLRFKSTPQTYAWNDAIMGELSAGPEAVDDFILIKSDQFPTYNFAHIIDDHEMNITHVIRGLEYIASMPKYLNLYDALGFDWPVFGHAPHIMAPDGKKKLSKRDGAKGILQYRDDGFLPAAMLNFLASLGWNDGTEQEIFSRSELIEKFSLDRVQRSGARFDEQRLLWMNGTWIRRLSTSELYDLTDKPAFWPQGIPSEYDNSSYKTEVLALIQERLKFFAEIPSLTTYFFRDLPIDSTLISTHKQLKKFTPEELTTMLRQTQANLVKSDFSAVDLQGRLNDLLQETGQKPAVLFSLIRIATTQAAASPGLAGTLAVIGKERSLQRISAQIDALAA